MLKFMGHMCSPLLTNDRVVLVLVDVIHLIGEIFCCDMVLQVLQSVVSLLLYAIGFVISSFHGKIFVQL